MSRHLRVVRDEPPAKKRRGGRPPPVLTVEQERAAKASIRGLADSIRQAVGKCRRLSAEILLRAALATSTPVERLITPGPREVVP
jgi:hypothetical protein